MYNTPHVDAGWSSPVARRAHNPKVVSSNLAPATNVKKGIGPQGLYLFFRLADGPDAELTTNNAGQHYLDS